MDTKRMRPIGQIPDDWSIVAVELKGYDPYALGCSDDGLKEENFSVPYALAYFLITHWAGTPELRALHRRELSNELKALLNI